MCIFSYSSKILKLYLSDIVQGEQQSSHWGDDVFNVIYHLFAGLLLSVRDTQLDDFIVSEKAEKDDVQFMVLQFQTIE